MFRKIIERIGRLFKGDDAPLDARASHRVSYQNHYTGKPRDPATADSEEGADPVAHLAGMTAEDLCGVREGMSHEQIDSHLKMLYRRHNRAASSLDDNKRAEADIMLDAIVEIRQRYLENPQR